MAELLVKIILAVLLLICGIQDIYKRKISLWIIAAGVLLTGICLPFCYNLSLADRIGGCAVGICIILLSKITGGKIGAGDGLLLCVTGLGLGLWVNLELFGIALFLAALLSILLLILRLADRQKSIPFVPFLLSGYIILLVATKGTFF